MTSPCFLPILGGNRTRWASTICHQKPWKCRCALSRRRREYRRVIAGKEQSQHSSRPSPWGPAARPTTDALLHCRRRGGGGLTESCSG